MGDLSLGTKEACGILGITPPTLQRLVREGKVAARRSPYYRFLPDDIEALRVSRLPKPKVFVTVLEKSCSRCSKLLPAECFFSHPKTADGLDSRCKLCLSDERSQKKDGGAGRARSRARKERVERDKAERLQTCSVCLVRKPFEDFNISTKAATGFQGKCKSCKSKHYHENAEYHRDVNFQKNYGISLAQVKDMIDQQEGLCAICGRPERGKGAGGSTPGGNGKVKMIGVDHNHDTGQIRGMLCSPCNTGIGLLGDSASRVLSALVYLRKWDSLASG